MPRVKLSPQAADDIEEILNRTVATYGELATQRYEQLLVQSLDDLAENPHRAGSTLRPEISSIAYTYHLIHSRLNVRSSIGQVKRPRHCVLFRIRTDGIVEVGRVLHDSMAIELHVPDDFID